MTTIEHEQFLTDWATKDQEERLRIAKDWVIENASHTWVATIATASNSIHGAGLSGLVEKLASENPFSFGGTITKIATLFARDLTNPTTRE